MRRVLFLMLAGCACASTVSVAPASSRGTLRNAIQLAHDGDLQADSNKMLDARERFAALANDEQLSPLASWAYGDPSARDKVLPRIQAAWKAAWPEGAGNPRVMLLRAMSLASALLERAVKMRPDFWCARKAALPIAR
jgi:hypothetical protein